MTTDMDKPCPKCGEKSEHVPPETVDVGLGCVPIEPDSWICPEHGHWCWMGLNDLRMEFPDGGGRARRVGHVLQREQGEPSHLGACEKCGRTNVAEGETCPADAPEAPTEYAIVDVRKSNLDRPLPTVTTTRAARED